MSKRNLTKQAPFEVVVTDTAGYVTVLATAGSKAAATRKANSARKDGGYASVEVRPTGAPVTEPEPEPKAKKAAPAETRQCQCGTITVEVPLGTKLTKTQRGYANVGKASIVLNTECTTLTGRRFAPGHDARYHGLENLATRVGKEAKVRRSDSKKVAA